MTVLDRLQPEDSALTKKIQSSDLIELAMPMVELTAHKIKTRSELGDLDVEDIQQELILHVIRRADQFDPDMGNEKAFLTQVIRTGVGMLLRKCSRQRSNPPQGTDVGYFSDFVYGPSLKTEERVVGISKGDGERRRQTMSRDPVPRRCSDCSFDGRETPTQAQQPASRSRGAKRSGTNRKSRLSVVPSVRRGVRVDRTRESNLQAVHDTKRRAPGRHADHMW